LVGSVVLVALGAVAAPHPAQAQETDERARFHFQAGRSYFDTGEYEAALREFERAYALSKRPALFYNISLVHERMGQLEKAVEYLRRYLEEAENVPQRATLEVRLQNFERRLERQHEDAATAPAPTETREHPEREPAETAEPDPDDAASTPVEPEATGEPAAAPASASVTAGSHTPGPDTTDAGSGLKTGAIVSYAAGGAGLLLFAGFGAAVLAKDGDFEDGCLPAGRCTESDLDRQDRFALLADVGLGLAAAGAVTGTVLLLLSSSGEDEDPTQSASVAVSPWLAPGSGGASAKVTF
jgi:tetratricopeptide (TPR) repeat protein